MVGAPAFAAIAALGAVGLLLNAICTGNLVDSLEEQLQKVEEAGEAVANLRENVVARTDRS